MTPALNPLWSNTNQASGLGFWEKAVQRTMCFEREGRRGGSEEDVAICEISLRCLGGQLLQNRSGSDDTLEKEPTNLLLSPKK